MNKHTWLDYSDLLREDYSKYTDTSGVFTMECAQTHKHTRAHVHTHTHAHTHTRTCAHTHTRTHTHAHIYTHTHTHTHAHTANMNVCIHTYVSLYVHASVCLCVHLFTLHMCLHLMLVTEVSRVKEGQRIGVDHVRGVVPQDNAHPLMSRAEGTRVKRTTDNLV